jgi:tetratricopeptide (TPR) repeat protein
MRFATLLLVAAVGLAGTRVGASQEANTVPIERHGLTLDPQVVSLWSDPEFQRRFTESYIAETEIEPKVTETERKQMLAVMKLVSAGKNDEAIAALQKHVNDASSAVFDFTLANIYFQNDRLDEAVPLYESAVAKHPKFRRAWRNLALIRAQQSAFDKALPALTKVVELGGGDAVTYGLLGFAYGTLEDNLAAESAYRMAIVLDPVTRDWRMGLARALFRQSRHADAAALCETLLAKEPGNADLWLLQANAYIGMGQPMRAAENYEIVDRLGRATPDSLNMLADIYVNEQLFDAAVDRYVEAMEAAPQGSPERALRASRVLAARGAATQTERLLAKVESIYGERIADSDKRDMLKLRARIAAARGATETEVKVLEEIVRVDPLDGEALILLGQYHAKANSPERAVFYFEAAAGIEKFEADAKVRHAQLLVSQSKYMEALPLLRAAQQLQPRETVQDYLEQVERIAKSKSS